MRRHLAQSQPARLRELSARAADCFPAEDPVARVERTYHRLLAAPERGAVELLALWQEWYRAGRHEALQALGVALDELLRASVLAGSAHARALVSLGWIRSGRLPLRQAAAMAREAITLFDAAADAQGQIDARDQLGDVLQLSGDRAAALGAYREFHDIASRLLRDDPDNTDWQRDLSVSHNKVGGVYQAQGRLAEALAEYQAGQGIMRKLVARDPDNTDWQRDLSVSHNRVGGMYQAQGRLAEALAEYEADLAIAERLAALDPSNAQWQDDLAMTRQNVDAVRNQMRGV
jgi:tetratricopeptide (TPR) repeat protein